MKSSTRFAVILGLTATCHLQVGCTPATTTAVQQPPQTAVPVKTVTAVQTEVTKVTQQPATVHPFFETPIRTRVSGYVIELAADIGDSVKAGEILARVDVPELDKRREVLDAQIALLTTTEQAAVAGVNLATAALRSAQAKLEQAKSEQAGVEASLAAAEAEFLRTQDLVNRGSLQNRVLDEVRKKRDSELAAKEAVLSGVISAEAEVGVAEAETAAAEARLRMAKAKTQVTRRELDELDVSLSFANVTAPFDGVISQRLVSLGDLVEGQLGGGSQPLFVLSQVDKVRIHISVPESEAPFVQPGDPITLAFPSFADQPPMRAMVTRRSGSLDPSTRTMTVEAELDNATGKLLPGMFGQATIDLETKVARTMLPSRAVRFDEAGQAFVYLIDENNRVKLAEIVAGMDTGTEIEIVSGILPGETVIGPHLKRFAPGQTVQPL